MTVMALVGDAALLLEIRSPSRPKRVLTTITIALHRGSVMSDCSRRVSTESV